MTNIAEVIGWKFNYQEGMATAEGVITDFPGGIPSQADQDKWTKEYEEHIASTQYQRDRLIEYPTIAELVVALYDTDDKADIEKRRAEVKAKYPKE